MSMMSRSLALLMVAHLGCAGALYMDSSRAVAPYALGDSKVEVVEDGDQVAKVEAGSIPGPDTLSVLGTIGSIIVDLVKALIPGE